MPTTEKLSRPRKEDEEWAAAVELRLALDQQAPADFVHRILAEAHEAVIEAGRTARDLFGAPAAYARTVAEERLGEEHRARIGSRGMTPGERLTSSLATPGVVGLVVPVLRWISDGALAASRLVVDRRVIGGRSRGCPGSGRLCGTGCGADQRRMGFRRGSGRHGEFRYPAAGVLSEDRLFDFPVPALAVTGGALIVTAVVLSDATVDRWFTPRLRGSDERWLSYVEGLLRGRRAMPAAEARAHVQEARRHPDSTGDSAEQAFGRAEVYAMSLAEGPRREQRLARRKLYGVAAVALLLALLFADKLRDSQLSSVWFWFCAAAIAYWIWYATRMWWRASSADGRKGRSPCSGRT